MLAELTPDPPWLVLLPLGIIALVFGLICAAIREVQFGPPEALDPDDEWQCHPTFEASPHPVEPGHRLTGPTDEAWWHELVDGVNHG